MSELGLESGLRLGSFEQGVFFGFQASNIALPQWLFGFGPGDMGSGGPYAYNSTDVLLIWQVGRGCVPKTPADPKSEELTQNYPGVNGAAILGHWGGGIVYHLPDDLGP